MATLFNLSKEIEDRMARHAFKQYDDPALNVVANGQDTNVTSLTKVITDLAYGKFDINAVSPSMLYSEEYDNDSSTQDSTTFTTTQTVQQTETWTVTKGITLGASLEFAFKSILKSVTGSVSLNFQEQDAQSIQQTINAHVGGGKLSCDGIESSGR